MVKNFLEFESLESLRVAFMRLGCRTMAVKILSKQDDSKHQIYLATTAPLTQLFPGHLSVRGASSSETKSLSTYGAPIFSLRMDFTWVQSDGSQSKAPHASIIEYPQYPEVRFSGFLRGSPRAPDCLSGSEQGAFGTRALVFGIAGEKVFGTVITSVTSPKAFAQLSDLLPWEMASTCLFLPVDNSPMQLDRDSLLKEIGRLGGKHHKPLILKDAGGEPEECAWQSQSAGWTLEALLGIPRNSKPGPDKLGFEIKAVGSTRTSLITTEPDFGLRFDLGVKEYLLKYGHPAELGAGKVVFNGLHKSGKVNNKTGAVLEVLGWDGVSNLPITGEDMSVVLREEKSDLILAGWSLKKLAASWVKKHSAAVYVQSTKIGLKGQERVTFGPRALVGEGTTVTMFLEMVSKGEIFLDPGDSLNNGKTKSRTQWRINGSMTSNLSGRLAPLYEGFEEVDLASL